MDKIKKHWKEILVGLFIIFGMNRCVVACNRDTTINKQKTEIAQKDSTIRIQADSLSILKIRWDDAQKSQSTYQGIAIGNQQSLINEINSYKDKINTLQKENNQLKQRVK